MNPFYRVLLLADSILMAEHPIVKGADSAGHSPQRERDFVPDEQTAKLIAKAIWVPIYGTKFVKENRFKCTSTNGMWVIDIGSRNNLEDYVILRISRHDGRVSIGNTGEGDQKSVRPSDGLVPNSPTAVLRTHLINKSCTLHECV